MAVVTVVVFMVANDGGCGCDDDSDDVGDAGDVPADGDVLDVPPGEAGVGLQHQGEETSGHRGRGGGSGVRGGAAVVQVCRGHLPIIGAAKK